MNTSRRQKICLIIEYLIAVYVLATNLINVLNQLDILSTDLWIMRRTFWGPSLVVLLLIQYLLIAVNHDHSFGKLRPYIMGGMVAGIVSVGSMSMNLLLLFVLGCFVLDRVQKAQDIRKMLQCALIAAVGVEIYSVIMIIAASINGAVSTESNFLYSLLPDCLLMGTIAAQWLAENKEKITWKHCPKEENVLRIAGYVFCFLAVSIFLVYSVTINIGTRKIQASTEEVYLLENCEDTSYVLTAVKNEATKEYELRFMEYVGTNNQKVRIEEGEDGLYHIVFLKPRKSIQLDITEEGEAELSLVAKDNRMEQKWLVEERDTQQGVYGLRQASDYLLCYDYAVDGKIGEAINAEKDGNICSDFKRVSTLKSGFITESVARYEEDFKPTILMETLLTLLNGWIWVVCVLIIAVLLGILYVRKELGDMIALAMGVVFVWLMAYGAASVIGMLVVLVGIVALKLFIANRKGLTKEDEEENSADRSGVSV